MSRGLNNNNPGNIRRNSAVWKGEKIPSTDKAFKQFVSIEFGYRAMLRLLQNYKEWNNCKTVNQMIARWAPPVENNTQAYIRTVCKEAGIAPNQEVDVNNKMLMCRIAAAMSKVENGVPARMEDVEAGWNLL